MPARRLVQNAPMIGVLVIGQSPRPDLIHEFRRVLPANAKILLRGVLDGLSHEEIARLAPTRAADTLFTVLPGGLGVKVSHDAISKRARCVVQALQQEGCELVAMCCTGEFPELEDLPVLFASRLHTQLAVAIGRNRRLGIYVPLPDQRAVALQRWRACGFEHVTAVPLVPKSAAADVEQAATSMAAAHPDLIVYDCMSYDSALRAQADAITQRPAILSISLLARVVAELSDVAQG